ncbi:hypothetical protein SLEP1_g6913 [Rubroshorea leprosula]|uniref:Uncharacterized protein n=1 Tax=Rubroshorea leprosula TaxID=152421 RepID=A0AAV5HWQ0_9ROSI|nr:hypothetical protein SLEP1_g6913 [Rubroshorea leprosula]
MLLVTPKREKTRSHEIALHIGESKKTQICPQKETAQFVGIYTRRQPHSRIFSAQKGGHPPRSVHERANIVDQPLFFSANFVWEGQQHEFGLFFIGRVLLILNLNFLS